jgi:hypothetical protein
MGDPFPGVPGDREALSNAVLTRIVGGTRAAVRAMQTSRPYTPMDRSRGLFGVSSSGLPGDDRPTSAVT